MANGHEPLRMLTVALSRRKHGFDSRWARQLNQDISAYFSSDSWIRADIVRKKHRVADGNAGEKKRLDPVRGQPITAHGFRATFRTWRRRSRRSARRGRAGDGPSGLYRLPRRAAGQPAPREDAPGSQLRCRRLTDRTASNSVVASMTRYPQTNVFHGRRPYADAHGSAS
jgi:hypothetical protein